MYIGLHVKRPLFLSDFSETWIFFTDFRKILKISNSMKIRPVRSELFHADGQKRQRWQSLCAILRSYLKFQESILDPVLIWWQVLGEMCVRLPGKAGRLCMQSRYLANGQDTTCQMNQGLCYFRRHATWSGCWHKLSSLVVISLTVWTKKKKQWL